MLASAPTARRELDGAAGTEPRWRVLFVTTSSDVGGTESFLRELVLRLDARHFEPVVCSLKPCGQVAQDIAAAGVQVVSLNMSERPRIRELAAGVLKLARCMDDLNTDLVQSFLYRANTLAGLAARLARRRPVVVAGQRSLYPLGGRPAALAARWTRQLSDRVVAVSDAVSDELIRSERLDPQRIIIIENGVDVARFKVDPAPGLRDRLGLAADTLVVGGVGRLSLEKGFHHLVESIALVRRHGVSVDLVLAGDGPERSRLERDVRTLGLEGHAHFLGMQRDPRPVYAALDMFALPSLEEGSPNALLEAMACGRAVVAARVGGVPEIVEHERSGLLVEPGSPAALAAALERLAVDPVLRRQLGHTAARRVREQFDISQMVAKHAALYRDLLLARHAN
jgi:glycosyltransferase involved in cell wall biosynthesis